MTEREQLLMEILQCRRVDLYIQPQRLDARQAKRLALMEEKRREGIPLQYILGFCEFYGLRFNVTPDVFIPRPETEILVEKVIEEVDGFSEKHIEILDIGTGSGNIAVSLAFHLPQAHIVAVDISTAALRIAQQNALRHRVENRIYFCQSSLFSCFYPLQKGRRRFDIIVSNPPYVSEKDYDNLPGDVRQEPSIALKAGPDGLDYIEKIVSMAAAFLKKKGQLFLEIGEDQAEAVKELMKKDGKYSDIRVYRDLAGRNRVVKARPED